MAHGGMHDQLGGGFHRYSVDGNWFVPHFEKMLYDQAQLVLAYLEASQASDDPFFAQIAEDTLQYVQRDMTDAAGGFYSAEDADSVPPEPAPATRTRTRWKARSTSGARTRSAPLLGDDSLVFEGRYGVLPNGNAPFDPQQEFVEQEPAAYRAQSIADLARASGKTPVDVADVAAARAQVLFDVRHSRPRPQLDDKVLTAWNGLMIAAFARASRVLPRRRPAGDDSGDPGAPAPGERGSRRRVHQADDVGRRAAGCSRRYRAGDAAIDGYAEDYAYLIFGVLEVFQADRRGDVARLGARAAGAGRTSCSGTPTAAAGSAPPAPTRPCCCG